jgi:hypothetical protein
VSSRTIPKRTKAVARRRVRTNPTKNNESNRGHVEIVVRR